MYRNCDGANASFGDTSVRASGFNPDELAVFAAQRGRDNALTVMLVHKLSGTNTPVTVCLTNFPAAGNAQIWQLTASNVITRLPDALLTNGSYGATLPAQSLTLLVLPARTAPRLSAGRETASGPLDFKLEATPGQRYRIEESDNLTEWWPFLTNTVTTNPFPFTVPVPNAPLGFFRAVTVP